MIERRLAREMARTAWAPERAWRHFGHICALWWLIPERRAD